MWVEILNEVFDYLNSISKEEFVKKLKEHENGDIANSLRELRYFEKDLITNKPKEDKNVRTNQRD